MEPWKSYPPPYPVSKQIGPPRQLRLKVGGDVAMTMNHGRRPICHVAPGKVLRVIFMGGLKNEETRQSTGEPISRS